MRDIHPGIPLGMGYTHQGIPLGMGEYTRVYTPGKLYTPLFLLLWVPWGHIHRYSSLFGSQEGYIHRYSSFFGSQEGPERLLFTVIPLLRSLGGYNHRYSSLLRSLGGY